MLSFEASQKATSPFRRLPDRFPNLIRQIADIAGEDAAKAIAESRGGQENVYFPMPDKLSDSHWLSKIVGLELAKKICQQITGKIQVPMYSCVKSDADAIIRMTAEGKSQNFIASELGISTRTVRRWRRKSRINAESNAEKTKSNSSLFRSKR